MIDLTITLAVIVGVLIFQWIPFLIYGLLNSVFVVLLVSLVLVYERFRQILARQYVLVVSQSKNVERYSCRAEDVEYDLIDESKLRDRQTFIANTDRFEKIEEGDYDD